MRKDRRVGLLCAILSLSVFLSCLPRVARAEETEIPCYSVTEGLSYEVSVSISSSWDTHANLEYVLTNVGEDTIHNWYLTLDLPYQIEGIWNAYVFETNGPDQEGKITYTLKNAEWNQDIQPGTSVSFGMTVASLNGQPVEIKNISTFYLLNTCEKLIDPSSYTLTYQEYSNWGTGYNGGLFLTNTSSETIEDWRLSFEPNRSINELSGVAFKTENEKIQITNAGNNQNLYSYATQNLTVNGAEKNTSEDFSMSNVTLTSITYAYTLTEDKDFNGIADYIDFIQAEIEKDKQDEETEVTPEPTETPVPTAEPTEVPEITEIPDVTATPEVTEVPIVTEAPTSTPTPEATVVPTPEATPTPDPLLDSDEDGIPDYYEAQLGTDPYSQDSDGDHIDDAVEMLMGLDPLSSDTDEDGIPDDQEDDDGDGLTLLQELEIGTYTWTDDSDWDGISDGDEVNIYGTDPTNPDSDEDGISDGDELKLGTDPTSPDSDNDGIPDGHERFLQTRTETIQNEERPVVNQVEVALEGTGCLDSAMTIKDVYGIETYTSDMMGLVGVPVEFEYEGEFDEATLTFHYDPEALASTHPVGYEEIPWAENYTTRESSLGILYYDEESGMFVDCDATVDTVNHTVSCTTTHFSIYIVADVSLWYQWWASMKYVNEMRPSHEGYDGIDYVLEIPCVTSMTSADIAQMNAIAYLIIGNMQENDRMAVSGYNSSGYYHYGYTNDKELLRRQVTEWPWNEDQGWLGYGGTTVSTYGSILSDTLYGSEIFNIASSHWGRDENNELVAIAFNNSTDIDCWFYSTSFRAKTDMTAYIFTLSSGDPNTPAMKWLNLTAGDGVIDCEGKSAKEVYDEYAELYELRQGVDNDPNEYSQPEGDGLWDIYEEQGMLATNGRIYYSDPLYKDSDSDTLTDAQEMGTVSVIEVKTNREVWLNGNNLDENPNPAIRQFAEGLGSTGDEQGIYTIYWVKSDPRKEDTDGDFYSDISDPHPKYSDIVIVGIEGDFDPIVASSDYVKVYDHPNTNAPNPSYGGDQDWFTMPSSEQGTLGRDYYIDENGCGIIALADLTLYYFANNTDISFHDYYEFAHDTMDLLSFYQTAEGIFYPGICAKIDEMALIEGNPVWASAVYVDPDNPNYLLMMIWNMLENGKPVITSICVEDDLKFYVFEKKQQNTVYQHDFGDMGYGFSVKSYASGHYFNITGIMYDEIGQEVYLRVSNGGYEEYVLFSEYMGLVESEKPWWDILGLANLIICF